MCGRYTLTQPSDMVTELDADAEGLELAPRFNIAPTQNAPVVRARPSGGRGQAGGREVGLLRWGLIPFWAKDATIGNRMINARSETVAEKPSFKNALKRSRCVVLADGFYEWRKMKSGKQPYHIHLTDRRPFALAGLWDRWKKGPDGPVESFTILTTDANEKVSPLHNRMPVFLDGDARDVWLDPSIQDAEALVPLLRPYADDQMDYFPVSKLVNSPTNDIAQCLEPVDLSGEENSSPFGPLFDLN